MEFRLRRAGQSDMPHIYRMIAEGRASLAARGVDHLSICRGQIGADRCDPAVISDQKITVKRSSICHGVNQSVADHIHLSSSPSR